MNIEIKTLFWLAGLFEGEASFAYGVPTEPNNPRIYMRMTDEDVIERVSNLFGLTPTYIPPREENWKDSYFFTLKGARAVELMQALHPLMSKRRQEQIERAVDSYMGQMNAKITENQAREIKSKLRNGEKMSLIAAEFHVTYDIVKKIKYGKTWKHIE